MTLDEMRMNAAYGDWPLHYDALRPEVVVDAEGNRTELKDTGIKILPNGDVQFRVYAPGTKRIEITSKAFELEMTKDADGFFTAVLPFDPIKAGPHSFDFIFDGTPLLYPYAPISWHRNRPVNYVDIPDVQTPYVLVNDVPHGTVSREIFWSETTGNWERCIVYTPPGYMKGTEEYPVLYLQHGLTENEVTWEYNGRVSSIMDNLIAEGKIVPFIVVMNNGMLSLDDNPAAGSALGDLLIKDCIPYIEKTYRVKTDKWGRAMAGLSMGSMQTSMYGTTHPELFGYLGLFSGFMCNFLAGADLTQPHLKALDDTEKFAQEFKVYFRSIGDKDNLIARFLDDDKICAEKGIDRLENYHRVIYENQFHEFGAWRRALYDFAQLIFK